MSNFRRTLRQTLTVARRDFIATVFTPTFLLFLFAPVIMISFGAIGGLGAQNMAQGADRKTRIVAIAGGEEAEQLRNADRELRRLFASGSEGPPPLSIEAPRGDLARQAREALANGKVDVPAVLFGSLERPHILQSRPGSRGARYLGALAEQSMRDRRIAPDKDLSKPVTIVVARESASIGAKGASAFFAVFGLFFLTLLLAGQAVGTMAEERSNKVIEVLAAAVPLESVFLGKLIGMFGVALLFLAFWGTVFAKVTSLLPGDFGHAIAELSPAVGQPAFGLLFFGYFAMAYMLLGAVFLGVGAQASTQREIQMLSLPITIFQVGMFGFSAAAVADPDSWVATAAEIFPFSSPFAMAGRAANAPELWPHFAALAWQGLWVAITVAIAAYWFRRGVLQSGSPKFKVKRLFAR